MKWLALFVAITFITLSILQMFGYYTISNDSVALLLLLNGVGMLFEYQDLVEKEIKKKHRIK